MSSNNHHEIGAAHVPVELPSNRSFGIVFAVVFTVGTVYAAYHGSLLWITTALLAAAFAVSGLRNSVWLTPLNKVWTKFGLLLGLIVAPVALGILFFVVITPLAIAARAFGKDFLRIKPDATKSSYWIHRVPSGPDAASMHRQF